jgi:quercetin dioxygenase-like cupin family protein
MKYSRRDLSLLLPALAAATTADAQDQKTLGAETYLYEDMKVTVNGQNKGRATFSGVLQSGIPVSMHLTELGPGQIPHAPHKHPQQEIIMVRRGILDATSGDETVRVTAGSVVITASNVMHDLKNLGTEPAEYFLLSIGNPKG